MPGRVPAAMAVAVITCGVIWWFIGWGTPTTASNHTPDQTYVPDGLYWATIWSLTFAVVATTLIDLIIAKPSALWFISGFTLGVVIFLFQLPWSNLDKFGGQMFSIFDWWRAPILAVAFHFLAALRIRLRPRSVPRPPVV